MKYIYQKKALANEGLFVKKIVLNNLKCKIMNESEIMQVIFTTIEDGKISNYFIAKNLNVSKSTVANWINGKSYPDLPYLVKLCDLLNLQLKIQ